MKSISLQRSLDVRCWRVVGQVAWAAKRPELLPVLLRARELGSTDVGDIADHLLFDANSRRVVAQRLLQIAELYKLLEQRDRRYVLTESGRVALRTEQIFVPEQGAWTIWATDDPLLPTPILRVDPWSEPSAYEEIFGKDRDAARERPFEKLPPWLLAAVDVVATPVAAGGAPLRIDELETQGEVAEPAAGLRILWDVSAARLRVEGSISGARVNTSLDAPQVPVEDVWKQLLESEGLWTQWDPAVLALRVGFDDASAAERESLVRAVAFRRPEVAGCGRFDNATVEGVALRARSAPDAARWAEWRLRERVRDYATAERFADWTAEAVAPFAEFRPSTPSRQALADAAWRARIDRPTPAAWHLVAAEDWGL